MGETTKIEWADRTWSPWIGCTKVSPACDGCYAEHLMDTRLGRVEWGPHGERSRTSKSYWRQPLAWNREAEAAGRTISVFPSLCDPFDNQADPAVRREWFDLMRATPNLLWLLLTKRPQNITAMCEAAGGLPPDAALGATCEDQKRVDLNVLPLLRAKEDTGARIAFLSCEPLLGPVQIPEYLPNPLWNDLPSWKSPELDWIIAGGETGQGKHVARPSHPAWFRSLRDQCAAAGVPFLFKQWGDWAPRGAEGIIFPAATAAPCIRLTDRGEDDSRLGAKGDHPVWMQRIGKAAAGRLLDGVTHDGFPAAGGARG